MKIVAIKIGKHWYRSDVLLPIMAEHYGLFATSRLRNETARKLNERHGFNDILKYAYYDCGKRQYFNLQKPL